MSADPGESVAELYRQQVGLLFMSYPPNPAVAALQDDVLGRFRGLADWLAAALPPCPELWRAVQELHVSMMLSHAAVAANWRAVTATATASPRSVWPKGSL